MKFYRWSFILFAAVFLSSCAKQIQFQESDRAYIFTLQDLKNADYYGFKNAEPDKKSTPFFVWKEDKLNGIFYIYVERIWIAGGEVKISTTWNIQSTEDRAKQLYDGTKSMPFVKQEDTIMLDKAEYGIDEGVFLKIDDLYTIGIIRGKLYYSIQIEGIPALNEEDFKAQLRSKLENIRRDFKTD